MYLAYISDLRGDATAATCAERRDSGEEGDGSFDDQPIGRDTADSRDIPTSRIHPLRVFSTHTYGRFTGSSCWPVPSRWSTTRPEHAPHPPLHNEPSAHARPIYTLARLTQGSLLEVGQVLLDVVQARRANDDRVPVLALHLTVVRQPAERNFAEAQAVLLCDLLDIAERLEVRLVPVPVAVVLHLLVSHMWHPVEGGTVHTRPWFFSGSKREPASGLSSIER